MKRIGPIPTAVYVVLALATSACGMSTPPAPTAPAVASAATSGGSSPSSGGSSAATVPQPPASDGLALAPEADRVDLAMPTFTDPILIDDAVVMLRSAGAGQAAIDTARMARDLKLRHRPPAEIDLARFDLWLAQIELDATAEDADLVNGDFFALDYVRDRILHVLEPTDLAGINLALEELLGAVQDEDYIAVTGIAAGMRQTVAALMPTP
ncbi:MAG: hypothetical protein M3406_14025 [Chloroflexota bacterium]|nr:hypothetical protein [Chloroflexota bacterium]